MAISLPLHHCKFKNLSLIRFNSSASIVYCSNHFYFIYRLTPHYPVFGVFTVCRDLSHNNLTGAIPATIANITNLQTVDLSRNKLTGGLPKQLSDLPHLVRFNISHNQLSGDLPPGSFFDTIPLSSVSDNPGLCGAKLNSSCPGVLPKPIVLNPDSSSDPLSQPEPTPNGLRHKKTILSISALVAIGAAVLITVGVITITVLNLRVRTPGSHSAAELELSDGYLSQSPDRKSVV